MLDRSLDPSTPVIVFGRPAKSDTDGGRPGDPSETSTEGKKIKHRDLCNLLNLVSFREGTVFVCFRREDPDESVYIKAYPQPFSGEILSCRWASKGLPKEKLESYRFHSLLLSDGSTRVIVKAELKEMDEQGIVLGIPQSGTETSARSMDRFPCTAVRVRLVQAGMTYEGSLEDFNSISLGVRMDAEQKAAYNWLNPSQPVTALLFRDGELLFSGECRVIRMDRGGAERRIALAPSLGKLQRYKPKEYRCQRQALSPPPSVRFTHPFTGRPFFLNAEDISGMGVCVEEFFEQASLIPGMLIEDMSIDLAGSPLLACRGQVLYTNVVQRADGRPATRSGIVFLDLEARDQVRLSSAVHSSIDGRLSVCGRIEMDELWRFFFESGFIYPSKYLSIQAYKDDFIRTYGKLYLESPSIARHFFFRDKGRIFGHMSMLRYYPDSWIIQHHAASRSGYGLAGVSVLDEAGRFTNDFHLQPSTCMDYLMCYYRPDNRFPSRVFGNVARDIADPNGSSVDSFSYLHLPAPAGECPDTFQLFPARDGDIEELARGYKETSGGLMLDALSLARVDGLDAALTAEYRRQGFKRDRQVYSLKCGGRLEAVIQVAVSDLGLNLSNLTNCMHVFVVDPERLNPLTLFTALNALREHYPNEDPPVLVHPEDYLGRYSVPYEKKYALWVLDTSYSDGYFKSVQSTFRRSCRERDDGQPETS